jgi:hypothetical protein
MPATAVSKNTGASANWMPWVTISGLSGEAMKQFIATKTA